MMTYIMTNDCYGQFIENRSIGWFIFCKYKSPKSTFKRPGNPYKQTKPWSYGWCKGLLQFTV